jgi:hypothetical protein
MKLTNVKAMVVKAMTVGMLAGAFILAAPAKAQAQGFGVRVQAAYPPSTRDYYERLRFERERRDAFLRQQAWFRHQVWERDHRYGYGYRY